MRLNEDFDSTSVPPQTFELIPDKTVLTCAITDSQIKLAKNQDSNYIELIWEVLEEGPHKGRKVYQLITYEHQNQQAVLIGRQKLSAVCHALKVDRLADTSELHDKPTKVRIKIEKGKDGYEDKNAIGGFPEIERKAVATAPTPTAAMSTAMASAAQPAAPGKAPWRKQATQS